MVCTINAIFWYVNGSTLTQTGQGEASTGGIFIPTGVANFHKDYSKRVAEYDIFYTYYNINQKSG